MPGGQRGVDTEAEQAGLAARGEPSQRMRAVGPVFDAGQHLCEQRVGAIDVRKQRAGFQHGQAFFDHAGRVQREGFGQAVMRMRHPHRVPVHVIFLRFVAAQVVVQHRPPAQHQGPRRCIQVQVEQGGVGLVVLGHVVGIVGVRLEPEPVAFLQHAQAVALRQHQPRGVGAVDEVLHQRMAAAPARVQVVQVGFQRVGVVGTDRQGLLQPVIGGVLERFFAAPGQPRRQGGQGLQRAAIRRQQRHGGRKSIRILVLLRVVQIGTATALQLLQPARFAQVARHAQHPAQHEGRARVPCNGVQPRSQCVVAGQAGRIPLHLADGFDGFAGTDAPAGAIPQRTQHGPGMRAVRLLRTPLPRLLKPRGQVLRRIKQGGQQPTVSEARGAAVEPLLFHLAQQPVDVIEAVLVQGIARVAAKGQRVVGGMRHGEQRPCRESDAHSRQSSACRDCLQ